MFKNREFRVRIAKPEKGVDESVTPISDILDQEAIHNLEEAGKRLVKFTAIAVVGSIAALKVLDTLCEITVKKTKSADKD